MKLIKLESTVPIKAIPEKDLNAIIITQFSVYVSSLLSLTGDTSVDRLEIALPAVKELCWSMGFKEIKKMFEMYVDSKLSIKPIPNYFDRILFGKIVDAYKQQKVKKIKVIEPIEITPEDKRNNEILSASICFDYYIQNGYLNDTSLYLYKVLLDKFNFKQTEIDRFIEKSKELDKSINNQRVFYKKLCLRRYFDTIHAKGMHIKDII